MSQTNDPGLAEWITGFGLLMTISAVAAAVLAGTAGIVADLIGVPLVLDGNPEPWAYPIVFASIGIWLTVTGCLWLVLTHVVSVRHGGREVDDV